MEPMPVRSINLRPNKPDTYDGRRDFLVVNTWLYKVEQYLTLIQFSNPTVVLTEQNKVLYASTFLSGNAAVWWYTLVQTYCSPTKWEEFQTEVVKEFVPEDHVRRARDRLRKLQQTTSVSKYLAEFRNIVLTIPDISNGEKWDRFCDGLKYEVRLEVMKSTLTSFEEAAKIARRFDSAFWGVLQGRRQGQGSSASEAPTPMEIGNLEIRRNPNDNRRGMDPQRLRDLRNNACFASLHLQINCQQ